jgi:hypothetical protein
MALPPSAIEQLSRDPIRTPGWSGRLLMFAVTLLFISIAGYAGLTFGYEPYLTNRIQEAQSEMDQLSRKASAEEQEQILSFYSQLVNVKNLIDGHTYPTLLFKWIEAATHPNVYFSKFDFNAKNRTVSLLGIAKNVRDVTEQIEIFEKRPEVAKVSFSNVSVLGTGGWQFDATIVLKEGVLSSASKNPVATESSVTASTTSAGNASSTAGTSTLPVR